MARGGEEVPRPTPRTPYRVIALNRQVLSDWNMLVQTRRDVAIRCWDHLANTPLEQVGGRYTRLKANLAWCDFRGERLPSWQYEIDRRARVRVGIGETYVVIIHVSAGHPRENE